LSAPASRLASSAPASRSPAPKDKEPMVKVARMIRDHLDNLLTFFEHRVNNATSEGLNSKIQTVKKTLMGSGIGAI
jgi:transposase